MADSKTTALTANTAPLTTDLLYIIDDPGGSPASQKITLANAQKALLDYAICNGRLTLETGVPISTSDQTAKTTVYFTPYKGNHIGLYDGSALWTVLTFTELSLSLSGYTANKNYDIWVYNNAGTVTLDSTIWTNDTTRATALALQDGIYVKTGATDRRYLGTIRITGTTGQCEDSLLNRYVWNYYNRVIRQGYMSDATAHNYETGTWRSWNNNAALRVSYVIGVVENPNFIGSYADQETCYSGYGYDITNNQTGSGLFNNNAGAIRAGSFNYHLSGVGFHFYQAVEYGLAGATQNEIRLDIGIMG